MNTIKSIIMNSQNVLGSELKELVMEQNPSRSEWESQIVEQLIADYYNPKSNNVEPQPTVYYYVWTNKNGAARITRNQELSPKAAQFMNANDRAFEGIHKGNKFKTTMDLRSVIAMNISIKGDQLKELCDFTKVCEYTSLVYPEYQCQLADYILKKYYADETMLPKDTNYYKVQLQTTGVPKVVRDTKLSPRPLSAAEREWNAAHPDDI